jgi:hypothetical protein
MEVTAEHIMNAVTKAIVEAEALAMQFPAYQTALLRFASEASRIQGELISKIQPGMPPSGPIEEQRQ